MNPPRQISISLITAPEFNLEFLWWLTILFFVLSVIYFIGVFFIRNRINTTNSRIKDKKIEFSPMINEFLFYDDSNSKEEKMNYLNLKIQIRELIKQDFDRQVLTEVLLDLRKDLSGQSQNVLIELYKDLGLHHGAYEKLKSRKWEVISSGILELTTMEVDEAYGPILKFIHKRQSTVRKQAELAVVTLKEEGITYFLDNTKYKIAEWQQLKILDILRHKPNFNPPHFGLWLTSTNMHVVLFSLRLIKFFRQSDAEQSIITLLKHKKSEIQAEAIECIKDFHFISALPVLKLVYKKANVDIKIAILDAIGDLGSATELLFLNNLKFTERNFNIKSKVIGTLNKIDPESVMPTKNISPIEFYETEVETAMNVELPNDEGQISIDENVSDEPLAINNFNDDNDKVITTEEEVLETEKGTDLTASKDFEIIGLNSSSDVHENLEVATTEENVVEEPIEIDLSFLPQVYDDADIIEENSAIEEKEIVVDKDFSLDFMPIIVDEAPVEENISVIINDEFEPMFSLHDEIINEDETEFKFSDSNEQVHTDYNIDIDWSLLTSATENTTDDPEKEEPLIHFEGDNVSFSANFMSQEELEVMVLLENIEELGDCREIELLEQIIDENISELVVTRAHELIQKFSFQSPRPHELFSDENDLSGSVFEEIYNLADQETKVILLEEIKHIGGEKEIHLLEGIIKSESKFLADEATEALAHLKSQLFLTSEMSPSQLDEDSLLEINFELELNKSIKNDKKPNSNGSTLFDQLCAMSNSLYNKKDG